MDRFYEVYFYQYKQVFPMLDLHKVKDCLKSLNMQPQVVLFDEVDSTNEEARRRINSGQKTELLIIADLQTHGRGRKGRKWYSPRGGLFFTLVLRPVLSIQSAPLLGLLCACAVVKALWSMGVSRARVKWPNDILIDEHKVAGVLSEIITIDRDEHWVILGIGINQNIDTSNLPEEFRYSVTSMQESLGYTTFQETLVCKLLTFIDNLVEQSRTTGSFEGVLKDWRAMSATLGAKVRISDDSGTFVGIAEELLSDGSLLVRCDEGNVQVITGDVTHLRQD